MDQVQIRKIEIAWEARKWAITREGYLSKEGENALISAKEWQDQREEKRRMALDLFKRSKSDPANTRALRQEAIALFKYALICKRYYLQDKKRGEELKDKAKKLYESANQKLGEAIGNNRVEWGYAGQSFRIGMHSFE